MLDRPCDLGAPAVCLVCIQGKLCTGVHDEQIERLATYSGMVSMLPTVDNSLFKISGGNAQVPDQLLQHAMVQMCNASVTEIVKLDSGRYQLKAQGSDAHQVPSLSNSAVLRSHPLLWVSLNSQQLILRHAVPILSLLFIQFAARTPSA